MGHKVCFLIASKELDHLDKLSGQSCDPVKKTSHLLTARIQLLGMIGQNTLDLGKSAESQALNFLENRGLRLIESNFRCKIGEIDLIMRDTDMIVFVEVRYRRNIRYGTGAETVGRNKQRKIIASASYYLQLNKKLAKQACRFDVISMSPGFSTCNDNIEWIVNAFTA